MNNQPPKYLIHFLRWFCHPDYVEDIEGDLRERFENRVKNTSTKRAKWKFFWDVLRLFRPEIIRPLSGHHTLNHYGMLQHHLTIAFRSFFRYKGSFFINLLGLSSGLASVFLIYLWVSDELSMDKFHEKDDQLYQVMMKDPQTHSLEVSPATPHLLAQALGEEMSEVEFAAAVIPAKDIGDVKISQENGEKINSIGQFAEKDYFKIFSYNIIEGDALDVLADPRSIVISEELAQKLFGTAKRAVGNVIDWQIATLEGQARITGVFENLPPQSTANFDFILDFHSWIQIVEKMGLDIGNWGNQAPYTYLTLRDGADKQAFFERLSRFAKSKSKISDQELMAVKYSSQYLRGNFENGVQADGRIVYVRLFTVIALLILLIACINFMNLSTARASIRMKEVGIKKTLGFRRKALVFQFLIESLVLTIFSSVIAFLLVLLVLPQFSQLTGKDLLVNFNATAILLICGIVFVVGLLAGSYPALYLSGFKPISVFKSKLQVSWGAVWVRKGLVSFQFIISIVLISGMLVVNQQIKYVQNKSLGYDSENVIYFPREGQVAEKLETFLSELDKIPGVVGASCMNGSLTGSFSSTSDFSWEGKDADVNVNFAEMAVGHDMVETLGLKMLEGRSFSRELREEDNLIFNEAAVAVMGLEDPVGKTVKLWGNDRRIIGVVKDFHFESLHERVKPLYLHVAPQETFKVLVRLNAHSQWETLKKIDKFYREFNPGYSFDYKFLDRDYQVLYVSELRISTISEYFAGLGIMISCLGLLGLVGFTAERRTKEIGVRKVFGLSVLGTIKLISGDFIKLISISICIALPIGIFLTRKWLDQFAYRVDLEWWFFAGAGIMALMIAWFVSCWQAYKVARTNPVETLRDE